MSTEAELIDRLRKIGALAARAGTPGERAAAEAAFERVRAKLGEQKRPESRYERPRPEARTERAVETQFSMPDGWSRQLFVAICRHHGIRPYRYKRQKRTTVVIRAPRTFTDIVLWPEFVAASRELTAHLQSVTSRVIRQAIWDDIGEAEEMAGGPS